MVRASAVRASRRSDGVVEYYVLAAESWEECESLARFMMKEYDAHLIDHRDGICSRLWELRVGGIEFTLKHHEDLGNCFFAKTCGEDADALLARIAGDLNLRLNTDSE